MCTAIIFVKDGDVFTFDVLEWEEGYEFGRPCLMLSPVIRENSDLSAESLIESVLIDAVCDEELDYNNETDQIEWRGWNLKSLRKRYNESLKGKYFPKRNYRATRKTVKIIRDKRGELSWEELRN